MFAFRNQEEVCWHQCLLYTHCLQKKKKKTSTTNSDHTVPSCPRQTNPGSPFPRTDFWRCAPKRWNVSDAAQKSAEFVWGVHKEGRQRLPHSFCCSTVSCPLSHSCFHAHTHMQTRCVQCVHKLNYTHKKCTHTHTPTSPRTHTRTLYYLESCKRVLQANIYSVIKIQNTWAVIGQHSYRMAVFPPESALQVSHQLQEGPAVSGCSSKQNRLSEVPPP